MPANRVKAELNARIGQRRQDAATLQEIAKEFGLSRRRERDQPRQPLPRLYAREGKKPLEAVDEVHVAAQTWECSCRMHSEQPVRDL